MKNFGLKFLILTLLLLAVMTVRFDRNDFFIKKYTTLELGDSQYYNNYVDTFRGADSLVVGAPFGYRPLVPYVASFLPFSAGISINLLNALIMVITLFVFVKLLFAFHIRDKIVFWSAVLFIVSFPTFYYSTIGVLDPISMLGTVFCFYLVVIDKEKHLPMAITLFTFGKETVVFVLPIIFLYMWIEKNSLKKAITTSITAFVFYFAATYIIRNVIYPTDTVYFWNPSFATFIENITRPRAIISFVLSLGIPGFIALFLLVKAMIEKNCDFIRKTFIYYLALLEFIVLFVYTLFSAYSDGRFIWPASFFTILITAIYYNDYRNNKNKMRIN
jgi:hypothetical protein